MRQWAENIDATWNDFRSNPIEYHDAGEEQAVVVARVTGRAKVSGVPLDVVLTQLLTWREGKLWRNETFGDRAKALEAAGLSE
jgi:ketosteroid isomerase-like protein